MKTKTWKIGEYCAGGIITAQVDGTKITLIQKEWASQREINRATFTAANLRMFTQEYQDIDLWLTEITTSYYADKVMGWVNDQLNQTKKQLTW